MSLQDDVFDVEAALKDKPEAEAFKSIVVRLWEYEKDLEVARTELRVIREFKEILRK